MKELNLLFAELLILFNEKGLASNMAKKNVPLKQVVFEAISAVSFIIRNAGTSKELRQILEL